MWKYNLNIESSSIILSNDSTLNMDNFDVRALTDIKLKWWESEWVQNIKGWN